MRTQVLICIVLVFISIVSAGKKKEEIKVDTGYPDITIDEIKQAGMHIYERIKDTLDDEGVKVLIPGIIRLGFHACIHGCNGCINLRQPENRKLDFTVNHLEEVYMDNKWNERMSRADFWALAAKIAVEAGVYQNNNVHCNGSTEYKKRYSCSTYPIFIKVYMGRKDCATSPDEPRVVEMPSAFFGNAELVAFFRKFFDMNNNGAVAMMGAHTVGRAGGDFKGVWDPKNIDGISNSYYYTTSGTFNKKRNPFYQEEVSSITGADHLVYQFRRKNTNAFALVADAALMLNLPYNNKTTGYDGCRDFVKKPRECGQPKGTTKMMTNQYFRAPKSWAVHFGVRYTLALINGYRKNGRKPELNEFDNFFVLDFGDILPFNMINVGKIENLTEKQKQQLKEMEEEMEDTKHFLEPELVDELDEGNAEDEGDEE